MTAEVFDAIWLTAQLATISVVLLLILATPVAWWLAFTQSRMKIPIEALTTLPLVLPPTVLGFYLLILLGPAGWLGGWWVSLTGETLTFLYRTCRGLDDPLAAIRGAANAAGISGHGHRAPGGCSYTGRRSA